MRGEGHHQHMRGIQCGLELLGHFQQRQEGTGMVQAHREEPIDIAELAHPLGEPVRQPVREVGHDRRQVHGFGPRPVGEPRNGTVVQSISCDIGTVVISDDSCACLVLSHTGASRESLRAAEAARATGAFTSAITSFTNSP